MGIFEGVGFFVVRGCFRVANATDGKANLLSTGITMIHYLLFIKQDQILLREDGFKKEWQKGKKEDGMVTYFFYCNKIIMQDYEEDKIIDGFQSEEQLDPQQIYLKTNEKNHNNPNKELLKFILPPPQQIVEKKYSLQPDMLTGWSPRKDRPSPIPTSYQYTPVDIITSILLSKNINDLALCYLGPRYDNTFYSWYRMPFKYPYSHIEQPENMKLTNRQFCGQHPNKMTEVVFDSFFETGNLDCAIKVGENEYDLFMRVDSNTRGHFQWFNFKVKNMKKNEKYKLNICNFQKDKILYSRGMKPYILSKKRQQKQGVGWEQGGENPRYERKSSKSINLLEPKMRNFYFKLSIEYSTQYDDDEVQFSYCVPYSYSNLLEFLSGLKEKVEMQNFYKEEKLCFSLGGLEVPLITIHEEEKEVQVKKQKKSYKYIEQEKKKKKIFKPHKRCIVLSGRVHPGESNSSFVMEGFLSFLCSNSKAAKQLRTKIIFKIVPMLNPDGVAVGNYRTGLSGKDFNRQYVNPDKELFPQIHSFKNLVINCKKKYGDNLLLYLDFHGHSVRKNVFMYGPEFTLMDNEYYESRIFPKIIDNRTEMFRYYSCIFKITQQKRTTARAIFLKQHNISLSFTIEASNGSYYDSELLKDIPFNDKIWVSMGKEIGESLKKYIQIVMTADVARQEKLQLLSERKEKKNLRTQKLEIRKKEKINEGKGKQQKIKSLYQVFGDDVMKHILDEIDYAEQNRKKKQKISDDQMSEGISQKEDKEDDLDEENLNLLYQAIKTKKSRQIPKHTKNESNFEEFVNSPIEEEKGKAKSVNRKGLKFPNQSSTHHLEPKKITKVVNLEFDKQKDKNCDTYRRRVGTSLRKNFRQFVYSQKKIQFEPAYSSLKRNSPRSSGTINLNENIMRELQKMKSSSKKFKNEAEPLRCTTIDPVPKY